MPCPGCSVLSDLGTVQGRLPGEPWHFWALLVRGYANDKISPGQTEYTEPRGQLEPQTPTKPNPPLPLAACTS